MDVLEVPEGAQVHVPLRKTNKQALREEKDENPLLSSASVSVASYDEKRELIRAEETFDINLDYSSTEENEESTGATHVIVSMRMFQQAREVR